MKKIRFFIIIFVAIVGITPFTSFGETCKTCYSTPEGVSSIMEFITEMLGHINTIGTAEPYLGKYVSPKRFESGKFDPPKQPLVSKYLKQAKENLGMTLAIGWTYLSLGDFTTLFDGFASRVLVRNKAITRDFARIQELDKRINKKKLELSLGLGRSDTIGGVTHSKMSGTIEKYIKMGVLEKGQSKIDIGATYGNLLLVLGKLSDSLGHFVTFPTSKRIENAKKSWFTEKVEIKLSSSLISNISEDYSCTTFRACESSQKNLKEELKKIGAIFSDGWSNFTEEINISTQRLKEAYSMKNLKETFWTEQAIVESIPKAFKDFKNWRKSLVNYLKEEFKKSKKEKELESNDSDSNQYLFSLNELNTDSTLKTRLNTMGSIVTNSRNAFKDLYTITEPGSILVQFIILSEKINYIVNNIIGTKDSDEDCLVKNLGGLCENQCEDIKKRCYY